MGQLNYQKHKSFHFDNYSPTKLKVNSTEQPEFNYIEESKN
jgi:hypothetical protein